MDFANSHGPCKITMRPTMTSCGNDLGPSISTEGRPLALEKSAQCTANVLELQRIAIPLSTPHEGIEGVHGHKRKRHFCTSLVSQELPSGHKWLLLAIIGTVATMCWHHDNQCSDLIFRTCKNQTSSHLVKNLTAGEGATSCSLRKHRLDRIIYAQAVGSGSYSPLPDRSGQQRLSGEAPPQKSRKACFRRMATSHAQRSHSPPRTRPTSRPGGRPAAW